MGRVAVASSMQMLGVCGEISRSLVDSADRRVAFGASEGSVGCLLPERFQRLATG